MEKELIRELKNCYGPDAEFRKGQLEAIESVLAGRRTLVVQKTGWGKSLVYFMATKMLRRNNTDKFTLIISPLLALMNNQIESASRLGLQVRTINSENMEEEKTILEELLEGNADALIISPERLANERFKEALISGLARKIGMFVVDEAHCISDWGHDFRPDYRRIVDLVALLPKTVPVLATTATANNRVVDDIRAQLGEDIMVSRGELIRESIAIQTVHLNTREERLVWLEKNVGKLPGTGVIYCLTVNDCNLVNRYLSTHGIGSEAYYASIDAEKKQEIVERFMANKLKVLVATVAFGMGFDKPDISFVIHFQKPANLVAYYQQIGRAGRSLDKAYAVLMYGGADDDINEYFINSAFPTEEDMNEIVDILARDGGKSAPELEQYVNMKAERMKRCLKYLEVSGDIYKEGTQYFKTAKQWQPDMEKSKRITALRYEELNRMNEFARTKDCYMQFIARNLDDDTACACGKCSNCLARPLFDSEITPEEVQRAEQFIREDFNVIEPRKRWPLPKCGEDGKSTIPKDFQLQKGLVLSNYGNAGWGRVVSRGKYINNFFSDELVDASYRLLQEFVRDNDIRALTYIPSIRRPELVKDFARRLAARLGLRFFEGLRKSENVVCQKNLNNSFKQWQNAYESFEVVEVEQDNCLLVDDMIDSGWTLTCCGYKMLKEGSGRIYPYALANSAGRGDVKDEVLRQ